MYRSITDFLADLAAEQDNTVKIFSNVTEDAKSIKIHENVRTLERLAWHITQSITEIGTSAGLFEKDELHEQPIPTTMLEIITAYRNFNTELQRTVPLKFTDSILSDTVPMYGEEWPKGKVLSVLIAHEAHHRSQMTVIMRMVGLPVPGIYGPSKEEWAQMGMPPMD